MKRTLSTFGIGTRLGIGFGFLLLLMLMLMLGLPQYSVTQVNANWQFPLERIEAASHETTTSHMCRCLAV